MSRPAKTPDQLESTARYMAYQRGFRDGVCGTAKRTDYGKYPEYEVGYLDGRKASNIAFMAYLHAHDMEPPSVLR